jgi:TonB-linked SusC/RagA family outer membrane protein
MKKKRVGIIFCKHGRQKILMAIRLCIAFLFLFTLGLSANVKAQHERVTLNLKDVSIKFLFDEIQKQTNLSFVFSAEQTRSLGRFSVQATDEELGSVLKRIFEGTDFRYEFEDDLIIVRKQESLSQVKELQITGRVVDEKGQPLPGVTVRLKGALLGTATDKNGYYILKFPEMNEVSLIFSFVGMIGQEIVYTGNTTINVVMKEDEQELVEVIVTGVFTRKAESFTGAAKTFNKEDLKLVGGTHLFQSLKNLDPTLRIIENMEMGSNPNTLPEMTIRGTSTFPGEAENANLKGNFQSKPNQPLFVVDGFVTSLETVFDMDMNRIESVTILKDAASKALYGAQAANGVVVIETVGIGSDGVRLNYSGQTDIEMPDLTSYNLMNAEEKLQIELIEGNVYVDTYTGMSTYYERLKAVREGLDEYWLSKPLQVGVGQKHSLSFEMGTKEMKTSLEASYSDRKGAMKESFRQTFAGTLTTSYRKGNVLFRNIASITSNKSQESPYGTFDAYARANPYSPAYDENGKPFPTYDTGTFTTPSPLADAHTNTKEQQTYMEFTDNFYIEWAVFRGLKTTLRGGVTSKRTDADIYYPWDHSSQRNYSRDVYYQRGLYVVNNGKSTNYQIDAIVTYTQTFKDKHTVFGNATWKLEDRNYVEYYNVAQGYRSEFMDEYLFGTMYPEDGMPDGDGGKQRSVGVLGVMGYSYDERFLMDATLRGTGASSFGKDNRWGTFWSIGMGWNIHNERSMKENYPQVKQLKIRGSVGYTGNQDFKPEYSQAMYEYYKTEAYNYYWSGASLSNMENPQLKWQLKKDYDLGVDLEIGRIAVVFDWYQSDTENSVTEISLPLSTGFRTYYENLGLVRNKGIELALRARLLQHRDGFLNVHGNIATNQNKLLKLSDAMRTYNEAQQTLAAEASRVVPVQMYYDGMHINSIFAVPSAGIDPADGYEVYINRNGILTKQWDAQDLVNAGHKDPKYSGNFGFNGEYKGFGINAVFTFFAGAHLYNKTLVDKVENASIHYNMDRRALYGRWKQKGDVVPFRRIKNEYRYTVIDIRTEAGGYTRATTRFVQKSNELNLSSLAIYYDVNRQWLRKLSMERLRLQANMNDIWKWSTIQIERGTSYPFARTLNLSLSATF